MAFKWLQFFKGNKGKGTHMTHDDWPRTRLHLVDQGG